MTMPISHLLPDTYEKGTAKRSARPHGRFQFPTPRHSCMSFLHGQPPFLSHPQLCGFCPRDLSPSPMSIAGLPNRTVYPRAIQILTSISIGSTSALALRIIGVSSIGWASTSSITFSGSPSRNRLPGLCFCVQSHCLWTLKSDELTPGLLLAILSADFAVCLPLVMLEYNGYLILARGELTGFANLQWLDSWPLSWRLKN
jgi:hypothetical protein